MLMSVCVTIGGCCCICCRAKGKCCSKTHQSLLKYHNCKFFLCLLANIILILALLWVLHAWRLTDDLVVQFVGFRLGIFIGLVSNSHVSSSLRGFPDSVLEALQIGFDYANDTITVSWLLVSITRIKSYGLHDHRMFRLRSWINFKTLFLQWTLT